VWKMFIFIGSLCYVGFINTTGIVAGLQETETSYI
jgi:hypothetical protein